jgi:hypothetical protein
MLLLSGLLAGVHAQAQTIPGSALWQPGPGASGDDTYLGAIDTPANGATLPIDRLFTISGWFVDTTAQGWAGADDVQVFVGTTENGRSLTRGSVGITRNDLVAATGNPDWATAGWSATIDPASLTSSPSTLSVYVHTPSKGWWFTQISVNVGPSAGGLSGPLVQGGPPQIVVSAPVPGERVSIHLGNYRITGTARDPIGGPKAIDWIQVWLNGEMNTDNASFLGEATLSSDGTWELDWTPANFSPLTSNLYVYAHSDLTNKVGLSLVHFDIVKSEP